LKEYKNEKRKQTKKTKKKGGETKWNCTQTVHQQKEQMGVIALVEANKRDTIPPSAAVWHCPANRIRHTPGKHQKMKGMVSIGM